MLAAMLLLPTLPAFGQESALPGVVPYEVEGDGIPQPLTGAPGDPSRGAALAADRQKSLCVLCHPGPFPDPHLHGTLAPDLTGVGKRLTEAQIRLRVVDNKRLNPETIMPAFHRVTDDPTVAAAWRGRPILGAGEVEDIVAWLSTLKE